MANTYFCRTPIMLRQAIDHKLMIAWGHKTLTFPGIPLILTSLMMKKLVDEIFERFKETPLI